MKTIDYYMTPSSPWTYLGHARFAEIAKRHGAKINVKPLDYGVIFPQSGGLPLSKRAPQRVAYRMMELKRWRDHLGVAIVLQPKFFPVDANPAAALICAAAPEKRMAIAGDLLCALWKDDRNIADPAVLKEIGSRHGVTEGDQAQYEAFTQEGMARGVFGAPTFAIGDELFWGQDRLKFVDRALERA